MMVKGKAFTVDMRERAARGSGRVQSRERELNTASRLDTRAVCERGENSSGWRIVNTGREAGQSRANSENSRVTRRMSVCVGEGSL